MGFELHGLTSNSPCDLLWLLGSKTATASGTMSYLESSHGPSKMILTVMSYSLKFGCHLATRQLCQSKMLAHILSLKRKASTLEH